MNKIFVAFKPAEMSSNAFLGQIKKRYKNKKAGYSGTLDPFAKRGFNSRLWAIH